MPERRAKLTFTCIFFIFMIMFAGCEGVSFASYYGNHMVLQQAPKRAQIWGYAKNSQIGQSVNLQVNHTSNSYQRVYTTSVVKGPFPNRAMWMVLLDASTHKGPYTITALLGAEAVSIKDVLFGDVWLCSGQSNMLFTVDMMLNASAELAEAHKFTEIRIFTAAEEKSERPLYDLKSIEQPWSLPSHKSLGSHMYRYFSAVCWLYGKQLHLALGYPIGLIASSWGGTPIESWMSGEARKRCDDKFKNNPQVDVGQPELFGPHTPSVLYNAMILPFVNMTMYGAIWYQGESDIDHAVQYNCTFPAMIDTWREVFNEGSQRQTGTFPFGFVQLAPDKNNPSITRGFPELRWYQTGGVGYVPNARMKNVFMAVALDLPDFDSPFGSVHPRDKTTIGLRLSYGGLAVGYGKPYRYQGPWPTAYHLMKFNYTLVLEFDNGQAPIQVKNINGFEVCCSLDGKSYCTNPSDAKWIAAPVAKFFSSVVHLEWSPCANMYIMGVRYAWRESPCPYKKCAIYSVDRELPAPPFEMRIDASSHHEFVMLGQNSYHSDYLL